MGKYIRGAAVGYCLIFLNIKVNGLDLLPAFAGWLLLFWAICNLKEVRPKLALLQNFALVLTVWEFLYWFFPLSEIQELKLTSLPGVGVPGLVLQMMELYFDFQFLTELAELAVAYPELDPEKLLRARTGVTVLQTAMVLLAAVPYHWLPGRLAEGVEALAALSLVIFSLGFCVTIVRELFAMARELDRLDLETT